LQQRKDAAKIIFQDKKSVKNLGKSSIKTISTKQIENNFLGFSKKWSMKEKNHFTS